MKIYVVMESWNDYESFDSPVKAYLSKDAAEKELARLNAEASAPIPPHKTRRKEPDWSYHLCEIEIVDAEQLCVTH